MGSRNSKKKEEIEIKLKKAIEVQQKVGELSLAKGFLTRHGCAIQQEWENANRTTTTKRIWIRAAIEVVQMYTYECMVRH